MDYVKIRNSRPQNLQPRCNLPRSASLAELLAFAAGSHWSPFLRAEEHTVAQVDAELAISHLTILRSKGHARAYVRDGTVLSVSPEHPSVGSTERQEPAGRPGMEGAKR